jgi:hypothetical protein
MRTNCEMKATNQDSTTLLLTVQDELDNGLRALAGLRHLMAAATDPDSEGVHELVVMIEERFRHVDGLLADLANQTFGRKSQCNPH